MKTIYRFEAKDVVSPRCENVNAGAYNTCKGNSLAELLDKSGEFLGRYHRPPEEDKWLLDWWYECDWDERREYFFGFATIASLESWFDIGWFMDEAEEKGLGRIGV